MARVVHALGGAGLGAEVWGLGGGTRAWRDVAEEGVQESLVRERVFRCGLYVDEVAEVLLEIRITICHLATMGDGRGTERARAGRDGEAGVADSSGGHATCRIRRSNVWIGVGAWETGQVGLQHRSSQASLSEAGGRYCPRGQDPIHRRGTEGSRREVSVSVSAEGASVFVTADSLSPRGAAQQGQLASANGASGWWQWMLFFVCFLL